MIDKMRQGAKDEKGFTMIELLVVMLIIGILSAIAIPVYLNQKSKATDASPKELARTSQTVAETYATEHNSRYLNMVGATVPGSVLAGIEPTLNTSSSTGSAYLSNVVVDSGGDSYTVTATSPQTGNTFSSTRFGDGTILRTCTVPSASLGIPNQGGCPNAATGQNSVPAPAATAPATLPTNTW